MRSFGGTMIILLGLAAIGCNKSYDKSLSSGMDPSEMRARYANQGGFTPAETKDQPVPVADGKAAISAENSRIDFVGTEPGGKFNCGFSKFSGTIKLDDASKQPTDIDVTIDMESVWADNNQVSQRFRTPEFFNVNEHPKATFTATKIEPSKEGDATHTITGDLTLRGTKKPITFPATIKVGDDGLSLKANFKINRKDFGVSLSNQPVDDDVTVTVHVGVTKK